MAEAPEIVAYLVSQYPATSHTFISREVTAVRDIGLAVETFSVRPPSLKELEDPAVRQDAKETFTVLQQPLRRFASAHLAALFSRPRRYLEGLGLAVAHRAPGVRGLALGVAHFVEAIVLAQQLKRRGVTRLHNHFANSAATVGLLAAKQLDLPWSFTIHGISEFDYPAGLMLGRKIEAAQFVACVSWFGRAQAMRLVDPKHWHKLHIVRCGLPLASMPERAEHKGRKRIICVGRLSPEKGQAGLLEAFDILARERDDLELLFVGDGPERNRLQEQVENRGLAAKVAFVGRCSETETLQHIAEAEMLVVSSFMEGLPIVIMEAMAMGVPVIASRVAGIPELVDDGQTGLLFTPSDWNELAERMRVLIGDPSMQEHFRVAGRSTVEREYDIRVSAQRMSQLFQKTEASS